MYMIYMIYMIYVCMYVYIYIYIHIASGMGAPRARREGLRELAKRHILHTSSTTSYSHTSTHTSYLILHTS